jgi:dihydrofolate synthase / folylpolyglutamate synthase
MFTRIGAAAYKKDLDNTLVLLEALGNPHHTFKSIHIAGTNGKGSTSHMLAAIMHKAGYRTGLYTSPHLYDFRERIKTSGAIGLDMCSEDFVVDFTQKIKPQIEAIEPSFFEVTVAMAFEWFAQQKVDIAIIETGLGGRLDSTNVIIPELSIITNIGWDHMQMLGDTLAKIAFEKAGIIKNGIPVVIGEILTETKPVFLQKAEECKAQIIWAENTWEISTLQPGIEEMQITMHQKATDNDLSLICDLPGMYQQYNIRTVLSAWEWLYNAGWNIPEAAVRQGLQEVKTLTGLGGRWQVIAKKPYVVLDVAHNENGMEALLKQISLFEKQGDIRNVHMVMGMVKDKDIDKTLAMLPKYYQYYFTQAQIPRALPFIELKQKAAAFELKAAAFENVNIALAVAKNAAGHDDLIIVCGSIFVVAEVSL